MRDNLIHSLGKRLLDDLPGERAHIQMQPRLADGPIRFQQQDNPRKGAVMVLLYEKDRRWHFPLIQRPTYEGIHSGQISLPGGKKDPEDQDLIATALRETHEEIGISPDMIQPIGQLSEFYVGASNHQVLPVIGLYQKGSPRFVPDNHEVEMVIEAPLENLLDPSKRKETEMTPGPGYKLVSPYYDIHGKVVWGATAMMLSELAEILNNL